MNLMNWFILFGLINSAIIGGCLLVLGLDWALAKWRERQ
jgi:hypothetical protein